MPANRFCVSCGAELGTSASYCHRCGTPVGGSAAASAPGRGPLGSSTMLPWAVAGISVLCLFAFIIGQTVARAPSAPRLDAPAGGDPAGIVRAPDISQMSPEDRANRLYQRVMEYVAQGKDDSVQFFAPMAIQSFLALAPLDAHRRYDLGLVALVSGDGALARAQADSILAEQPSHLLGLILAIRAAGLRGDTAGRQRLVTRLLSVLDRERAKRLAEYIDHETDIDSNVRELDSRTTPSTAKPPAP